METITNYEHLAKLSQCFDTSPAAIHGNLVARICFNLPIKLDDLISKGKADLAMAELAHLSYEHVYKELELAINNMYQQNYTLLQSDNFDFDVLLPDDEVQINKRVAALVNWCIGFAAVVSQHDDISLSADAMDALEFIQEAAELGIDTGESEDAEKALFEVREYLRLSIIMLFMELSAVSAMSHNMSIH